MSNKKKPPALRPKEPTAHDPRRELRIAQQKIKRRVKLSANGSQRENSEKGKALVPLFFLCHPFACSFIA